MNGNKKKAAVLLSLVLAFVVAPRPAMAPSVAEASLPPARLPAAVIVQWAKVAICETGGRWHAHDGDTFSGGIGISHVVWNEYGGKKFAPAPYLAGIEDQITIARRIQASAGLPNYVPDQNGCTGAW